MNDQCSTSISNMWNPLVVQPQSDFPKLFFWSVSTLVCAIYLDYAIKTRVEHKRLWKIIILKNEFTKS